MKQWIAAINWNTIDGRK